MRSLISTGFPAPKMEPESAHVVSAVRSLVFQQLCGLWRPERQLGMPFLSEAGLRRFLDAELGPSEQAVL